jgi:two-component system sensor kinase FixL
VDKLQTAGSDSAETTVCTAEAEPSQATAKNSIEELQKKIDSISAEFKDFVYIISHDLKAPLRAIKALTDWLAADYADKFDADGKEQLKMLTIRVDRMNNLLEGVLQYSRIGRITEEKVEINLNELVPEIIATLNAPSGIHIAIENPLPAIVSEPTRIRQVFENLLSNAVRFMGKPEGSVMVGCIEEEGFWKFSVSDTGPGIDQQHFEKIFRLFQTLQAKDQFESTGVGLTIAKKIIELYGGRIWLTSKIGQGSTFYFTMPKQT